MRNMHIFDAIQHTDPKTFSRSCEIDVDHKSAPQVALCDARLRSPGTVTPGQAVQNPARAHRVACALHLAPAGIYCQPLARMQCAAGREASK
mmetsp:Transcript_9525/g.29017  ORF Transcript_9525/g.29017 Transcript_9525/m.29017 type:complete len:92 (-) Transcript_9525:189-464(-)